MIEAQEEAPPPKEVDINFADYYVETQLFTAAKKGNLELLK